MLNNPFPANVPNLGDKVRVTFKSGLITEAFVSQRSITAKGTVLIHLGVESGQLDVYRKTLIFRDGKWLSQRPGLDEAQLEIIN